MSIGIACLLILFGVFTLIFMLFLLFRYLVNCLDVFTMEYDAAPEEFSMECT